MRLFPLSLGTKMALVASLLFGSVVIGLGLLFTAPGIQLASRLGQPIFFLVLVGLTILFTTGVLLFLSYWFVDRPLLELMKLMKEAPNRDFLIRAPVKGRDVLARLSQSFNQFLEKITTLDAFKIDTERELGMAKEKLKYQEALSEKNQIIVETNRNLEERLKELRLLYEFSQKVSAALEIDELYNVVEQFIGSNLGFQEFTLLVLDHEEDKLLVKVARGFQEDKRVLGMSFGSGEGITGRVWDKKEITYIPDTSHSQEYLHYKGEKREDGSFLSIPLLFKNRVVGVLNMFRKGIDQFSPEEIQFINTLTVELAIAVENAKLYSRTRELSVKDELTQLYNRRYLQDVLPLEIKRSERFGNPLTVLMMDIDYFKKFNDRYGHLAGDQCLKEFVQVVNAKIREVDIFARFGGEEFMLILPNTSKEDGIGVAEKICKITREHRFRAAGAKESSSSLSVSIGVASCPSDAQSMEDLIDAADIALYEAKARGRDTVVTCQRQDPKPRLELQS